MPAAGLLVILLALACRSGPAGAADFYLAPAGNDANPGTRDQPCATLARARDAVRRIKAAAGDRDLAVAIAPGTYRLSQTVAFGLEDSAAPGHTITYQATENGRAVFTSGVPITGWRKLDAAASAGLPPAARDKVWVADVSRGQSFRTLYNGDHRLPRARSAGFVPEDPPTERLNRWHGRDESVIKLPVGAVRNWALLRGAELLIIPAAPWAMNILPLTSADEATRTARTAIRGTYLLAKPNFGDFASGSAWIENSLEFLDAPGEWVLDSPAGKLYLWPEGDQPGDQIVAPTLTELVRVEGRIDYAGPRDTPVRGLVLRGLEFTQGDRFVFEKDHAGWGLQHDWEMFDRPTALVRLRGAEQCVIDSCRFVNSGGAAVRLDLHCRGNRVANNEIAHIGGVGILLAGYGPGVKDVNRDNEVVNNLIHHVGEVQWQSPAIFAWQSGHNRVAHNLIHDTPYAGIVVSGRIRWDRQGAGECSRTIRWPEVDQALGPTAGQPDWRTRERFLHARQNVVELNDIHDVMQTLTDGNGIYISGAGAGNLVRHNYVHDCPSVRMAEGIRCDDDQHQTIIDGNIIYRIGGLGTGIVLKGINDIVNNVIVFAEDGRRAGVISLQLGPVTGSRIQRNIIVVRQPARTPCAASSYKDKGPPPRLADCRMDKNVYFCQTDPQWGQRYINAQRPSGNERHSLSADPLFVDLEHGDFRFQAASLARQLGIEPIDVTKIGLQPGHPYERPPVAKIKPAG